ncbi:hypothetical protein Plhal703r1_c04g0021791 [Plasmopara halstedii]
MKHTLQRDFLNQFNERQAQRCWSELKMDVGKPCISKSCRRDKNGYLAWCSAYPSTSKSGGQSAKVLADAEQKHIDGKAVVMLTSMLKRLTKQNTNANIRFEPRGLGQLTKDKFNIEYKYEIISLKLLEIFLAVKKY